MRRLSASPCLLVLTVSVLSAAQAPGLVLRIPGSPDSLVTAERIRNAAPHDVPVTSEHGESVTYRAVPLLEILEKGGLDLGSMASERKTAPAVVVAVGRDGYTVVFSVGELTMHRSDPRVFVAAESSEGPLPAEQGPVRLVVIGQRARSAFALASIDVRFLAENKPSRGR